MMSLLPERVDRMLLLGAHCDDIATGAGGALLELCRPVDLGGVDAMDVCGTGGDGSGLINVSTAAGFVAAACGARISKHGNRSVSSKSGSADVLEALGVPLTLTPAQIAAVAGYVASLQDQEGPK